MTTHVPILVGPIVEALVEPFFSLPVSSGPGGAAPHWLVDCTLGGGGHTAAFLAAFAADERLKRHKVLALDQDGSAIERARTRFSREISEGRLELLHSRFADFQSEDRVVLGLMADLGFSSDQLEDADRGLSFQGDGPLDMRLDQSGGRTARDILLTLTERELEKIFSDYGEERFSRRIASIIIESRREKRLPKTTRELAELISRAVPPAARHSKIHPATRCFQALRIFVNDELKELDSLLERVTLNVKPKGRVAILSFHSLEDRKVKQAFKGEGFEILTKKPIEVSEEELRANPRSRSAKLRIAEIR
jgi:16S rRNA (cytosine1402-N4)-methyltransferase